MGSITRGLSNNITTGGVILPAGITNASVSAVTSFPNASGGTLMLLSTQTASSSANISFTTGLDSTYDEYIFKLINVRPATDSVNLSFNLSTNGGSNYNVTKTSLDFFAGHNEGDTNTYLEYDTNMDLAQSTGEQKISDASGNDADQNLSGTITLFNPSSTTYVKHFISCVNNMQYHDYSRCEFTVGYGNTTSAINAIRFQFSSGNIADGIFKLYGVKKS
jgi:hypothetical protein